VDASDPDGSVAEVRLYINDIGIVALKSFPYNYTIDSEAYDPDAYTIRATAIDDEGDEDSDEVTITISESTQVVDFDGNVYESVSIGNQVWIDENIKSTHYSDGTPIQEIQDASAWDEASKDTQAYSWYENNPSLGEVYGALYTWPAAVNGAAGSEANPSGIQGVCPEGWHVPSESEWLELEMYLGMSEEEAAKNMFRGTDEGGMLKDSGLDYWSSPNTGATNETWFTALPGGARDSAGTFYNMGGGAFFWTASGDGTMAGFRSVVSDRSTIEMNGNFNNWGYSVRCVKDK